MLPLFNRKDKHFEFYDRSKVAFTFSFRCDTLTYGAVNDFLNEIQRITGIDFRYHLIHGPFDSLGKHDSNKVIDNSQFKFDPTGEELLIGNPFHHCCPPNHIKINLTEDNANLFLGAGIIDKIISNPDFCSLYVINRNYSSLQNSSQINAFVERKMPLQGIKYKKELFAGEKVIDIIKNPGCSEVIKDSWLMAGWKMWFRNEFINNVIGKNIQDFPDYYDLRKESSYTFLQLYEKHNEPHFRKNISHQDQFKIWIDFEQIVLRDRRL